MGISQITSTVLVFLTGLLPASCHKTSPTQKTPATPAAASANSAGIQSFKINLGELPLTNNNDTCVLFSTGESCTMTPKLLDGKTARITMAFESRNDFGETSNFSVKQVTVAQGKPVEVSVGHFNLSFTPKVSVAAEVN